MEGGPLPSRGVLGTAHARRTRGGSMRKRNGFAVVAMFATLTLIAAACKSNNAGGGTSGTSGGKVDCNTVQFGCVTYASGEPIRIGTLLAIAGSVATLGNDSYHGVQLAIDHLDGKFDGTPGQIDGHDVQLQPEDDGCSKTGGQQGARKLAADPPILLVVGK